MTLMAMGPHTADRTKAPAIIKALSRLRAYGEEGQKRAGFGRGDFVRVKKHAKALKEAIRVVRRQEKLMQYLQDQVLNRSGYDPLTTDLFSCLLPGTYLFNTYYRKAYAPLPPAPFILFCFLFFGCFSHTRIHLQARHAQLTNNNFICNEYRESEGDEVEYNSNVVMYSLTTGLPLYFAFRHVHGVSRDPYANSTLSVDSMLPIFLIAAHFVSSPHADFLLMLNPQCMAYLIRSEFLHQGSIIARFFILPFKQSE